jgi:hypothetical protein
MRQACCNSPFFLLPTFFFFLRCFQMSDSKRDLSTKASASAAAGALARFALL